MNWLTLLDLTGVFVFALSGGLDAAKHKLDILGVSVLAVATGVGGGIMRDVLMGVTPPAVFIDETYLIVCLFAGLVVILFAGRVGHYARWIKIADAVGLGLFAAIGANKAMEYELGWVGVIMISTLSAAGGGVIRDLLVLEIPMILRADIYAIAAIIGGASMLLCDGLGFSTNGSITISALLATSVRLAAIRCKWSLPGVRR